MISLWLKIWKLGRYFFQLKLLLHHFAALQRELKWFPKVYRISCHWSLAIPSHLNPVPLLQMDCSLHSSWLPTLISFVLLQLVGAPTIYYLVYEVLNAAIRLLLNHYGYDLMIWRTWLLKSFYEELLCFCHRFVHVIKLSFVGILHLLGHLPHFVKGWFGIWPLLLSLNSSFNTKQDSIFLKSAGAKHSKAICVPQGMLFCLHGMEIFIWLLIIRTIG